MSSKRRPVGAWPRHSPSWVPEHLNQPTTLSPSAMTSTTSMWKSGNESRKGPTQRRASAAIWPAATRRSRRSPVRSRSRRTAGRVPCSRELLDQKVHHQAVGPLAVDKLRAACDSDGLETHCRVGLDRALVAGVRVDREAVVAALRCEPADRRAQRVRAEAAALDPLGHRDVEGHRAVLRLGLLHEAEPADQLAVELDGPSVAVHAQVLVQPVRLVGLAPPACNARLADYLRQSLEIGFG